MKRVVPLMLMGALTIFELPAFSAPIGAYSQVMQAVYARDEAALKYLVSVGLNINATNMQGKTALCTAVENQDYEGYELLLSQGATTRTPCMRNMNPEVLNRFAAEQPPLGTYYKGAALTASRNGALMGGTKDVATTVGSLPYPHLAEILLAGVAVGTVAAVGGHGSGGGNNPNPPVPPLGYESPFDNDDKTASNYLASSYFSAPTAATLSKTQKGGISGVTEDLATAYGKEYNAVNTTGLTWKDADGNPVGSQNFLSQINAADAYARGYSGYKIDRSALGSPILKGWDAVDTSTSVKIAIMDDGLFWNEDLKDGKELTGSLFKKVTYGSGTSAVDYYQSVGKNYTYGVYSDSNNENYWLFDENKTATLYLDGKETSTKVEMGTTVALAQDAWNKYAGQFAHICSGGSDSYCLVPDETGSDGHRKILYTASYTNDGVNPPSMSAPLATYYVYDYLWKQYEAKYGENGYKYASDDATGTFFQTLNTDGLSEVDHGTHIAGIIAGLRNGVGIQGVAYNADIVPIKLDLDMAQDIEYIPDAVSTGARIINLSIGPEVYVANNSTENSTWWNNLKLDTYYSSILATASKKNATALIFAAGNEKNAQSSIFSVAPLVDAAYKNLLINVVALGSVENAEYHGSSSLEKTGDIASYSNRCGATASYCLAAPGGDSEKEYGILSTGLSPEGESSYDMKQGTSMAAPMVSGSLAVIMGAFPFLTTQQAVQILLDTATYIPPTTTEIDNYNSLAGDSNAYAINTVDGKYNAIYGRGLVNLNAATDPIGLPKITFDTMATSANAVPISTSSAHISSTMGKTLKALPENLIVLDDYTRAYQMSTKNFVRTETRSDALRRSFRSFMAQDEKEVRTSDTLSFAFSKAPSDKKSVQTGSMSMMMRLNKNVKMRLGFTEDTASFGGSYVGRSLQNPFMNMRQAFGADANVEFAKNWALMGSWYTGKNGFIDEDIFDKMSKHSRMQLVESGVAYKGFKDMTLGISGGIMDEEDSLFGTRGAGAFKTNGAETRFVRVMANYQPTDKFRLSGSYTYGMTEANTVNSLMQFSSLTSDSFALAAEYVPDEKQTFGIKMISPLRVRSGSATFNLPVARDMYEDRIYRETFTAGLKPTAREYDLSLFYMNEISSDLLLAGETGVRLNPDHQQDASPDYRALFKLNWTW